MIHWFPSANVSLDKSFLNSGNLSFDGGYIFGNGYSATGFRTRFGVEKITPSGTKAAYYLGSYVHGRYTIRLTQASRISNNGAFIKFSDYFTRCTTKIGISVRIGTILELAKKVHLEMVIGLGFHSINIRNSIELNEDMMIQDEWFTDFDTLGFFYSHISFPYTLWNQKK